MSTIQLIYQGQEYFVWHKQSLDDGPVGQYLVDASGAPVYVVDPGINGTHRWTADGRGQVAKFDAPKATLMSYKRQHIGVGSGKQRIVARGPGRETSVKSVVTPAMNAEA